jgi:hypothetical protein
MVVDVFNRVSKSPLRPIQIGRRLVREINNSKAAGATGKPVAPNVFAIHLSERDRAALGDLEKALIAELADAANQYAEDEGCELAGTVSVSLVTDAAMKAGKFEVRASSVAVGLAGSTSSSLREAERSSEVSPPPAVERQAPAPPAPPAAPTVATPSIPSVPAPTPAPVVKKATLVMGDGTRIALKVGVVSVGRSAESTVPLNDTNVSRRHAEIRSRGEGANLTWILVDLGSTNGTMLNGVKITAEQKLKNGDALMFGSTPARFEVA